MLINQISNKLRNLQGWIQEKNTSSSPENIQQAEKNLMSSSKGPLGTFNKAK